MRNDRVVGGHELLAVERYRDGTRHMALFDALADTTFGRAGERLRLYLTDEGYAALLAAQKHGEVKIRKHAAVIEGHLLPDRRRRKKH